MGPSKTGRLDSLTQSECIGGAMLIELADNLLDSDLTGGELEALDTIMGARRRGYHLLLGSGRLFQGIQQITELSQKSKSIINRVKERQIQKQRLRRTVTHVVRISRDAVTYVEDGHGTRIINMRLTQFRDYCSVDNVYILGENLSDARLFIEMARWYAISQGLGQTRLSWRPALGGGTTTAEVFGMYRDEPRPCLCVVDRDAKSPGTAIGSTASAALGKVDPTKPWAVVHVIPCRTAENALPTRIVEAAVERDVQLLSQVPRFLEPLDDQDRSDVRDHCDFKNGTSLAWILSLSDGDARDYWMTVAQSSVCEPHLNPVCLDEMECRNGQSCSCWIFMGFGGRLLEKSVEVLRTMSIYKTNESICDTTRQHWENIGRVVFSWACGTAPTSV